MKFGREFEKEHMEGQDLKELEREIENLKREVEIKKGEQRISQYSGGHYGIPNYENKKNFEREKNYVKISIEQIFLFIIFVTCSISACGVTMLLYYVKIGVIT